MGGGASKPTLKEDSPSHSSSQHEHADAKHSRGQGNDVPLSSDHQPHRVPIPVNQHEEHVDSFRRPNGEDLGCHHTGDEDLGCHHTGDDEDEHEEEEEYDRGEEEQEEVEEEEDNEEESEEAMQLRMLFAQSAMSMDMDNEDLIFNLMYFGGDTSNFATMMNNAAEETVAAHSAGNTPYKLTPATEQALQKLKVMAVTPDLVSKMHLQECSICQEEMCIGEEVALMPGCLHCFHNDCVLKWFSLQSWCPVCRTKIIPDEIDENDENGKQIDGNVVDGEEEYQQVMSKGILSEESGGGVKANLGPLFSEAALER